MRKKGKLKVLFVVIMGLILLLIPITMQVNGETSKNIVSKYLAIGDDVSLESTGEYDVSYVSLIKDFLESLNKNLSYTNLSCEGATSEDLIKIIDENPEKIKDCDIITISIGGNNILNPALESLYNDSYIDKELLESYDEEKFDTVVSQYLNNDEVKSRILEEVQAFESDFPNIIKKIKKLSPNAHIYVNTVYNPINKKGNIYDFFNEQINLINNVINKTNIKYDFEIIDCYNILNNDESLNFSIEKGKFEIEINKAGHAMMATQVISDYEDYVDLEVEKVTTNSKNIKGKTVPNSNIIILSDKGAIATTQAKQNGEFEVKIPSLASGTNLEILVYDNKVFSILYTFENVVVKKALFTS